MANLGFKLGSNKTMHPGDILVSAPRGLYTLTMQLDGNLTLGHTGQTAPPWAWQSGTFSDGASCKMSLAGDLIIIDTSNKGIAHSATSSDKAYVAIDDIGNIHIYTETGGELVPPWDNAPMYPYPAARLLVHNLQVSINTLQVDLRQVQMEVAQLEAIVNVVDAKAVLATSEGVSRNGSTMASARA